VDRVTNNVRESVEAGRKKGKGKKGAQEPLILNSKIQRGKRKSLNWKVPN